jgi:hypothetical protein
MARAANVQQQNANSEIKRKRRKKGTEVEPGSEGWVGDEVGRVKAEVCQQ